MGFQVPARLLGLRKVVVFGQEAVLRMPGRTCKSRLAILFVATVSYKLRQFGKP